MIEDRKQSQTTPEHLEENSDLSETKESADVANVGQNISPTSNANELNSQASTATSNFEEEKKPQEAENIKVDEIEHILQQEIALLKQRLEEQTQQSDSAKSQYVRMIADFDNFRKRTQKEKEELEYQIKKNTINELLSVVDNFERARSQIKPANDGEMTIHKSYQGVYKILVDSLKRIGVSAMRPEGQLFDPNAHEAMLREATDEYPEGTVIEQLVRGYLLGERVLRPAMVKVAVPKENMVTSEEETEPEEEGENLKED
jgi:molecular chaperone GrpE